jgi:hypothetical protein
LFGHGTSENILLAVAKHCTLPLATVALTRPEHLIKEFIIFLLVVKSYYFSIIFCPSPMAMHFPEIVTTMYLKLVPGTLWGVAIYEFLPHL